MTLKYSSKTAPPQEFNDWLALANDSWKPSYGALSGVPRTALFDKIFQEQGAVCAYCGRGIDIAKTNAHLDHFWPQSAFGEGSADDRSLKYENLFISCGPNTFPEGHAKRFPVTCGDAKGNKYDENHYIIPSDSQCEYNFIYGTLGTVTPRPQGNMAASNMIDFLNLGESSLQFERGVLLQGIENEILNGSISIDNKMDIIDVWRSRDNQNALKSLSHVAARYIEQEIV